MNHEITIEPRFVYAKGFVSKFNLQKEVIVQGEVFRLGLKITNVGKKPTHPFTIKGIFVKSESGHDIHHPFAKEYVVELLNPKDSKIFWISDFGTDFFGLASINLVISPSVAGEILRTSQINRFNSEEECVFENKWMDFFYIKSSHENTQEKTNSYLMYLSIAVVIISLYTFFFPLIQQDVRSKLIYTCVKNPETTVKINSSLALECKEYLKYNW